MKQYAVRNGEGGSTLMDAHLKQGVYLLVYVHHSIISHVLPMLNVIYKWTFCILNGNRGIR